MMMAEIRRCRLAESLTTDILIQILIRLPLESLLVCRKVCKSWNDLIRQPFFADLHRPGSPTITLFHEASLLNLTTFGFFSSNADHSSSGYKLNFTGKVIPYMPDLGIVGSCNGLICLFSYDQPYNHKYYPHRNNDDDYRLAVCNPILGYSIMLPDPPQSLDFSCHVNFGFGYIPSTGEYKVIKIVYMESDMRHMFHVCTIMSGSRKMEKKNTMNPHPSASAWRTVSDTDTGTGPGLPQLTEFYSEPTFFKGSIIWIAESRNETECQSLIYFDIGKEEMQAFRLPPTIFKDNDIRGDRLFYRVLRIGAYYDDNGNDHLYIWEDRRTSANIWVMEDYKSMDSLNLKWVIQLPHKESCPMKLLKVHSDGKLLFQTWNSSLVYYDSATGALETMENLKIPIRSCLAIDIPNLLGFLL